MKTLLYSLLGVALIASIGFTTNQFLNNQQNADNDLQATTTSSYITFIDDSLIDNLMLQLQGQTSSAQLQIIQSFVYQQRKFFNANSIMKTLMVLPTQNAVRDSAVVLMKPYIAPMSTNEALQILKMFASSNGIASGIIVSQVNDLNGNTTNFTNLQYVLNPSLLNGQYNIEQLIRPYSSRTFRDNFQVTFEGKHVGFVFDQSESMNTVAYTQADGTAVTRYQLLEKFYDIRYDIYQNFSAFSYVFTGNIIQGSCDLCSTCGYEQSKGLSAQVQNIIKCGGENDLYEKLSQLFANPYDQLSDVYILSDGIISSGTKDVNAFIKLVNDTNSQRRNKIRINSVSVLIGGNEDQSVKDEATNLLQTLADVTNGTFFQVLQQN